MIVCNTGSSVSRAVNHRAGKAEVPVALFLALSPKITGKPDSCTDSAVQISRARETSEGCKPLINHRARGTRGGVAYGLPKEQLGKLEPVLNAAVRMLSRAHMDNLITPILG